MSVSAPHRKLVNFTLKMATFVTFLIWEGKRFHCPIEETILKSSTGWSNIKFYEGFVNVIYYSGNLTCVSYLFSLYKSEMLW